MPNNNNLNCNTSSGNIDFKHSHFLPIFITRLHAYSIMYRMNNVTTYCSYRFDRSHRVCINNTLSDRNESKCGVGQGSVFGARLYSMYKSVFSVFNYCFQLL